MQEWSRAGVMDGFYWVVEGTLAGCPLPGGRRGKAMNTDLPWLRGQGISAVLTLTEEPLLEWALGHHGMRGLHLSVPDLTPPDPEQIQDALEFIDWQIAHGRGVAVHCLMGQGRTGTVLAAYLIRQGAGAAEAIAEIRSRCPGAIGSRSQERALVTWADRRGWII